MNQVSLTYSHYPDAEIFIVSADGLTHAQLRHYAKPHGFIEYHDDDSQPVLLGSSQDQKSALLYALSAADYEITDIKIVSALDLQEDAQ